MTKLYFLFALIPFVFVNVSIGQIVEASVLQNKNDLLYLNNQPYTGQVATFNSSGQVTSKYMVKEGVLDGFYETYFESKSFIKPYFKDTSRINKYTTDIKLKKNELAKIEADSLTLAVQLNDFINYKLGGAKKAEKLRVKNNEGKLNQKDKELFDTFLAKELEMKKLIALKKTAFDEIKTMQEDIKSEEAKQPFLPNKKEVYAMKNGKKNGEFTAYFEDGKEKEKGRYSNDLQEGEWRYFFTSGKLKAVGNFAAGDGGNLGTTGIPKNGREGKWIFYNENGQLNQEVFWKNGKSNGEFKVYYENGKLKEESNWLNDLQTGVYKKYYENGNKNFEWSNVLNGKGDGLYTYYHENGNKQEEGKFVNGLVHGIVRFYSPEGILTEESNFLKGKREGIRTTFYPSGKIKATYNCKNDKIHGSVKGYFENGKLESSSTVDSLSKAERNLIGDFYIYNSDGSLRSHGVASKDGKIVYDKTENTVNTSQHKCSWCGKSFKGLGYVTSSTILFDKDCSATPNFINWDEIGSGNLMGWYCSRKCATEHCLNK